MRIHQEIPEVTEVELESLVERLREPPVLGPFSEPAMEFCSALSRTLFADAAARQFPAAMALAYRIRKAELVSLRLPEADVLITNPVHYAVAVKYKHGEMAAPQIIAKGAGDLALKMRELANRHHITVVQNPPLARALFRRVEIDSFVPEELYPQVAKILVWVYAIRAQNARPAGA